MFFQNTLVGVDNAGNRYYKRGSRRFVRYATSAYDSTNIAPEWHLWLHHAVDSVPDGSSYAEASRFCGLGETSPRAKVDALSYVAWRP
ncbi:NADH-ubiquinone oxidoreductase subunit NDUFA12 family protein [Neorickettsia sennetsu]|nr:NADH-ubiquinone oxidoreductase subunit NDUFA12 family protein [Neorickettsia sennetsu]